MDYALFQRVLNIIKLKLWHKSNHRICIRGYMLCCDICNKVYVRSFDGYLCLRIFSKSKGLSLSRNIVATLPYLTMSFSLTNFELDIVVKALSKYYKVSVFRKTNRIKIKSVTVVSQ